MDAYESDTLNSLINKKHNIKKHRINPLEEGEEWKIEMLKELSLAKLGFLETDLEEADISTWLVNCCYQLKIKVGVEGMWATRQVSMPVGLPASPNLLLIFLTTCKYQLQKKSSFFIV